MLVVSTVGLPMGSSDGGIDVSVGGELGVGDARRENPGHCGAEQVITDVMINKNNGNRKALIFMFALVCHSASG